MSLSSADKKLCEKAMKYEKAGIQEFLGNYIEGSDLLIEIDTKEDEVVSEFQKLLRKGCKVNDIKKCVTELANDFLETIYFDDLSEAEVQSEDLFGLDHINFDWTKNMIKEAKKLENATNKSKKLKTWEHSYKKAVQSGVNIMDLDESIKALIAKHLRDMKGDKKKDNRSKKKKKSSKKKKGSKKN
jgi:hypothetical protein